MQTIMIRICIYICIYIYIHVAIQFFQDVISILNIFFIRAAMRIAVMHDVHQLHGAWVSRNKLDGNRFLGGNTWRINTTLGL